MTPTYTITRVNDAVLRLDRATSPYGAIAFALLNRDRRGAPVGWRLKPLTTVRGSKNQLWPTPEEVFASTKVITAAKTRAMIHALDQTAGSPKGDAP
jgi:hypothetical protein